MSTYVIPAQPVVGLPIVGSGDLFPVRRVYCVVVTMQNMQKRWVLLAAKILSFFANQPTRSLSFRQTSLAISNIHLKQRISIMKWSSLLLWVKAA